MAHMKLSDVEAQKAYAFRQPAKSFLDAYPTVRSIRVEVRPVGEGFEPCRDMTEYLEVYTEHNIIPAILDCRNPRCFGGGLDLDQLIRWAVVEAKQIEYETTKSCKGYEGTAKGRKNDGPCGTYFKVKVSVVYKESEESTTRPDA
jgi:hypothetical protein